MSNSAVATQLSHAARRAALAAMFLVPLLAACSDTSTVAPTSQEASVTLTLTSSAFAQGQTIPDEFSCKGRNISPALAWSGAPASTASYALIMNDPDAASGDYIHWLLFNIPAASQGLAQAASHDPTLSDGSAQGSNTSSHKYYDGPCPPSGTHRYYFRLYALDTRLNLAAGATADQLRKAIQGHILAEGELMGRFSAK